MSQELLSFKFGGLVRDTIHHNVRRRENIRFSRKRFDLEHLIELINGDDVNHDFIDTSHALIETIRDYESFSHVGASFGDRELGILGYILRPEYDYLNKSREYMANLIRRNPYLSKNQRKKHPETLMLNRKKMYKSMMGVILSYFARCIAGHTSLVEEIKTLFELVSHFKCTSKFDWFQHMIDFESEIMKADLNPDSDARKLVEFIQFIRISLHLDRPDDQILFPPLCHLDNQTPKSRIFATWYIGVSIEYIHNNLADRNDISCLMEEVMGVMVDRSNVCGEYFLDYYLENSCLFPLYHMVGMDLQKWITKTFTSNNTRLGMILRKIGYDLNSAIKDEITKKRKIIRMCSGSNIHLEQEIRSLCRYLPIDEALEHVYPSAPNGLGAFTILLETWASETESQQVYSSQLTTLYELFLRCATRNYDNVDVIRYLKEIKKIHNDTIQEHLYQIFRTESETRVYFVKNNIIKVDDIRQIRLITPDIIDLFAEQSFDSVVSLFRIYKKSDSDTKLLDHAFKKYLNLAFETWIATLELLALPKHFFSLPRHLAYHKNKSPDQMRKILYDMANTEGENITRDDCVLYYIKTRRCADVLRSQDYLLIRQIIRCELTKTIEYLADCGIVRYTKRLTPSKNKTDIEEYSYYSSESAPDLLEDLDDRESFSSDIPTSDSDLGIGIERYY